MMLQAAMVLRWWRDVDATAPQDRGLKPAAMTAISPALGSQSGASTARDDRTC
jgi:hypothetical protein